jgi:hypothetical protein
MFSISRFKLSIISLLIICLSASAIETVQHNYFDKSPKKERKSNISKKSKNKPKTTAVRDSIPTKPATNDSLSLKTPDNKTNTKKETFQFKENQTIKTDTIIRKIGSIYGDGYARVSKKNGDIIVIAIKTKDINEISYTYPLNTIEEKISMNDINSINYSDGKLEIYTHKPKIENTNNQDVANNDNSVDDQKSGDSENVVNNNTQITNNQSSTEKSKKDSKKKKDPFTSVKLDWETVIVTDSLDAAAGLADLGQLETKYSGSITVSNASLEKSSTIIMQKKAAHIKATVVIITDKKIERQYGELPTITLKGTAYGKNE